MDSDFIINYSWFFVLIVLIIGLVFSGLLYFKNKKNRLPAKWTIILFIFRFLSVSIIAFLLLNPFFKSKIRKVEKPIVIIGVDNSQSVVLGKDSTYNKIEFPRQISELSERLSEKYQVDTYLFGSETRTGNTFSFTDEYSDYADFFNQIKEDYVGQNVGAIVLAGDGISNQGIDAEFAASTINFPIYTVALGDTNQNLDLRINDVYYNSLAYTGDMLPFRLNISAERLAGKAATISITGFGKEQIRKEVIINNDNYNQSFDFSMKAESPGKQRITFKVETDAKEAIVENNRRDVFIDVLDTRKKLLILANAPHPDLGAIKSSLEQTGNYSIDIQYPEKLSGNIDNYDLVILHQLPSIRQFIGPLLAKANKNHIPLLYIVGKQTNIIQFNKYFKGLNIISSTRNFEDAQADINSNFSLFSYNNTDAQLLETLPPLLAPVGKYMLSSGTEVFAYQKERNINTNFPLVAFYNESEIKQGVIAGEGLWLWRINNFLKEKNYAAFDDFLNKTVQYLVARKDKRFFKITTKGEFSSNENILIRAELFDQSYKPVNNVEVDLKLTNEKGEQFNHVFSPDGNSYLLDAKILPEGIYRYIATTQLGSEKYSATGEFIVKRNELESRNLNANHGMLYRLADQHNGQLIYPQQLMQLPDILQQSNLKSKIYYEEKYTSLRNLFAVITLILLLLTVEWFVRKYLGDY